ncbi:MAG: methylmalonyl-CoA mutase, partial [Chloroflexi bacterium]
PTYEGITLQPIYRAKDMAGLPHLNSLPGQPPALRGSRAAAKPWLIAQRIPYSTAAEFNAALRADLARGQTAVYLPLDVAGTKGLDPEEAAPGEVGVGGVAISTVDDLAAALEGVDLETTPLFLGAPCTAVPTLALLLALLRRLGKPARILRGSLEMDPLGALAQYGEYPRSVAGGYDKMANLLYWAVSRAPQLQIVTVHGQPYANAGASVVQELAFVLATAVEYLREMNARELPVNAVAPHIRLALSIGSNYFMEVAKLRAARVLWAKAVKAMGGSRAAQKATIHAETGTSNKTTLDPHVNLLRVTTEAFAAAVGGADSLHTHPFDTAFGLPDEFSRRIARNTQLILQHEAHLTRVIDPAGGAWAVESLTDAVARNAWTLFRQVEAQGGMLAALQAGFPQAQVAQTAAERTKNLAVRKDVLVGTNRYPNLAETLPPRRRPDAAALQQTRAKYVDDFRNGLDVTQRTTIMAQLGHAVTSQRDAAIRAAVDAAVAGATLGELARALRSGDRTPATVTPLKPFRAAAPFEALRDVAKDYAAQHGHRPQVFLANIGPVPRHKARADFAADFFRVGGFEIQSGPGAESPESAAQAALDSGAPVVVICGADDDYPAVVPPLAQAVKQANPDIAVLLAGLPKDQLDTYKAAGVDEFIHLRANVVEILSGLYEGLGVRSQEFGVGS